MNEEAAKPTLDQLRQQVTAAGKSLLDEIWNQFVSSNKWPLIRVLHSRRDKSHVREALRPLGGTLFTSLKAIKTGLVIN